MQFSTESNCDNRTIIFVQESLSKHKKSHIIVKTIDSSSLHPESKIPIYYYELLKYYV